MKQPKQHRIRAPWIWTVALAFLAGWGNHGTAIVVAQVIEFTEVDPARQNAAADLQQRGQFELPDNFLEAQIMGGMGGGENRGIEAVLNESLQLRIDSLDRVCLFSDSQRQDLEFAGQGDIRRFLVRMEQAKDKAFKLRESLEPLDQEKWQKLWQEVWPITQPLQQQVQNGVHDTDSLFGKVVRSLLSPEQQSRYDMERQEQIRFRYHAMIDQFVADICERMPLTVVNRETLIRMIRELPEPTRIPGNDGMASYYVAWKISQIPEDQLRPMLPDNDWKLISRFMGQVRGMSEHIKTQYGQ